MIFLIVTALSMFCMYRFLFLKLSPIRNASWQFWFVVSIPSTLFDAITTFILVNAWGIQSELNPLVRFLFHLLGPKWSFSVLIPLQFILMLFIGMREGEGEEKNNLLVRGFIFVIFLTHFLCGINNVFQALRQ